MRRTGRVALFGEALIDHLGSAGDVPGGAPLNVAWHLQAFGAEPCLVSRLGNDADGARLRQAAARRGLDTQGLQADAVHPTGRVFVRQEPDGPRFEIPPEQAWDFIEKDQALSAVRERRPVLLYFGTLAARRSVSRSALAALLAHGKALRFLDLNLRAPWYDAATVRGLLARSDVVKGNEEELGLLSRLADVPGRSRTGQSLLREFRIRSLVVTRGEAGAWLEMDGSRVELDGRGARDGLVDTVGAGDAFAAVLILGLLEGWRPRTTLARADELARAICRIPGAIPADDGFYHPFLREWDLDGGSPPR